MHKSDKDRRQVRTRNFHPVAACRIRNLLDVRVEVDRAHDSVAELLVDDTDTDRSIWGSKTRETLDSSSLLDREAVDDEDLKPTNRVTG